MKNDTVQRVSGNETGWRKTRTGIRGAFALTLALGLAACDTDVVNPGPIVADFLDSPDAQSAIVSGAGRALSDALNWIGYTSAAVAREVHPSGSTGSFGITPEQQRGELNDDEVGTHWENMHRARFMVDEGLERITALPSGEQDTRQLAQLYLWGGYTYRLAGESLCQAVIDGGAPESHTIFFTRAMEMFDQAASTGSGSVRTAAIAGRASVKVWTGDWAGAAQDANTVLSANQNFSYVMPYFDIGDDSQGNRIFLATKGEPYRAHSQWNTWVSGYGLNAQEAPNGDPRVPYRISGQTGDAAVPCCGPVPWNPQTKYNSDASPIQLSSGAEMKLILAENALRNNQMGTAVTLINELRATAGMAPVAPANMNDAWSALLREHAIEMWLEGRRLPALRRWNDAGLALNNLLQPLERVSGNLETGSHLVTRDFCFPISEAEKQTNPNVPR